MRGLYAIVDTEALARRGAVDPDGIVAFARAVIAARPAALQLRDKAGSARRTLALLRAIAPHARAAGVPLVANDRLDLALLAGADGVHVGQDDLPVEDVRAAFLRAPRRARPLIVGLSTHGEADVERAIEARPDYVAVGPVFATSSKSDHAPVLGLDGLAALVRKIRGGVPKATPIVAIGGVDRARAAAIRDAGADAAAVIGGLFGDDDAIDLARTTERVQILHDVLRGDR